MTGPTITYLNRYTDERETIPDTYEAIDEFFATRDPYHWVEDKNETDEANGDH